MNKKKKKGKKRNTTSFPKTTETLKFSIIMDHFFSWVYSENFCTKTCKHKVLIEILSDTCTFVEDNLLFRRDLFYPCSTKPQEPQACYTFYKRKKELESKR